MAMSYLFEISEGNGILTLRVSGERPATEAEVMERHWEILAEVGCRCRENGINRILMVNTVIGPIPLSSQTIVNIYKSASELMGLESGVKVGIVVADAWTKQVSRLAEAIALEQGSEMRIFDTEARAIAWLES